MDAASEVRMREVLERIKEREEEVKRLEERGAEMDAAILALTRSVDGGEGEDGEEEEGDDLGEEDAEAYLLASSQNFFGITPSDEENDDEEVEENREVEVQERDLEMMEKIAQLTMEGDLRGLESLRENAGNAFGDDDDDDEEEQLEDKADQNGTVICDEFVRLVELGVIHHDSEKIQSAATLAANDSIQKQICELAQSFVDGNYFVVVESPIMQAWLSSNSTNTPISIEEALRDRINQFIAKNGDIKNLLTLMIFGASLLHLFLQANWTGPPLDETKVDKFYTLPFTDIKRGEKSENRMATLEADAKAASAATGKDKTVEDLDKYPLLHSIVAENLEASGEPYYLETRYSLFLLASRVVLKAVHKESSSNLASSGWWLARSATVHQESLVEKDIALALKEEMELGMSTTMRTLGFLDEKNISADLIGARFWAESAMMNHKFANVQGVKRSLRIALKSAGLTVKLSGALGKRTKFQMEDKSQLVLLASSATTTISSPESSSENGGSSISKENSNEIPEGVRKEEAVAQEESISKEGEEEAPMVFGRKIINGIRTVELEELDEHTPLREKIAFTAEENEEDKAKLSKTGKLTPLEQAIVIGLCVDVKNSYAMEQLTAEEMLAYIERVLLHATNWMVYSTALLIKAQLEFEKYKTKERSVLQMQILVDQQSDRLTPLQFRKRDVDDAAPVKERHLWLHALAWPPVWSLKRGLASKYLELGVAASALEIFTSLKLWEQAVECLVVMGRKNRAETLIKERLEVAPTPNLMCVLGNLLDDDASWYEKAWQLSNFRYSRAKRLLSVVAFKKGDYEGSIAHLEQALAINPLFPQSWFRMGVAAMRISNFQLARRAFAQVVAQEPADGEAWGNLCAVLVRLDQPEEALQAICEAVKHSRENWKMWENYVTLSLQTENWAMVINGMNHLIDLRVGFGPKSKKDGEVDVQALGILVEVILQNLKDNSSLEEMTLLKEKFDLLLSKIMAECKSDANVWRVMADYYHGIGDLIRWRDMLLRRFRVLQQVPDWERSETTALPVVEAVNNLFVAYSTGSGDEDRISRVEDAKVMVRLVISKCDALFPNLTLNLKKVLEE